MIQKTIDIELKCDCGKICGTLTVNADDPRGIDLKNHDIDKVECDECNKKK